MSSANSATPKSVPRRLEGARLAPTSQADMREAVHLAFDYRGDVTIEQRDGSSITGFVSNRDDSAAQLTLWLKGQDDPVSVPYDAIQAIVFSGADPAFGQSWDDWQHKSSALRAAEAERLRAEALARGEL